ncbi:hypothetical protein MLD38_018061 [Melastoma candidum]|uniref:Uncharacterized protein n=1 Tax=Melastoma candidum TaxID=119954 RepID=A0ACB9QSP1_9MYRT|nr:hypothetical protein MLD38_018061 [Melastoma candidum]
MTRQNQSPTRLVRLQVEVQISLLTSSSSENPSPRSPSDFGIKTKNSHPASAIPSPSLTVPPLGRCPLVDACLPGRWKCQRTTHASSPMGPTRRPLTSTTDCILESCCNSIIEFSSTSSPETRVFQDNGHQKKNFLSFCDGCNKSLEENDIYIYRGEKAFCSCECRLREILMEERLEKLKS